MSAPSVIFKLGADGVHPEFDGWDRCGIKVGGDTRPLTSVDWMALNGHMQACWAPQRGVPTFIAHNTAAHEIVFWPQPDAAYDVVRV